MIASDIAIRAIARLCGKNKDGEFCFNAVDSVEQSPPDNTCCSDGTCPSTCQAQISQANNTLVSCFDVYFQYIGVDDSDTELSIRNLLMRCDVDVPEWCDNSPLSASQHTIFHMTGLAIPSALVMITLLG